MGGTQIDMGANGGMQSIVGGTQDANPKALEHSEAPSSSSKIQWLQPDLVTVGTLLYSDSLTLEHLDTSRVIILN